MPIGQLTNKELAFAENVFSIGNNMVLPNKAPSFQHQSRSSVGRAPLCLYGRYTCTCTCTNCGGAGSNPVVAEHFFGSYQIQVNKKTEQHQLYNFARFYHSWTSDKCSKNVFILKMYKVALICCR